MITVPVGRIGLDHFKDMNDSLYGNRVQRFTYHLQTNDGTPKGQMTHVTGGRIEFHKNAAVKGGGKLTVQHQARDDRNWLKRRIKIVMHIEGMDDTPLGVFIPSAPVERWDDMNLTLELDLLDKCSVLDSDYVLNTYTLKKGTKITRAVRDLIVSAGEKAGSISDHPAALKDSMTWEAGTSKLEIINDILSAGNFYSLDVDGNGHFQVAKFRMPRNRPVVHRFLDNGKSIYTPDFTYEKDHWSVPNRVVLIGQGTGDEEAMTATAVNRNDKSPYSFQQRGRWITHVEKGVHAVDQQALDEKAERLLQELTSPAGSVSINHAPLPYLGQNDVVRFRRKEADIDVRCVVASTQIDLDPTALQRTQLMEVAEL